MTTTAAATGDDDAERAHTHVHKCVNAIDAL